ncbi:MAG: cytochrome c-type biogenesis protein CcmH [Hyphomonadaceae bacterium]|jgi:cytochrome c-type biogenesis protein CcmH|uniref:cytochrome c-type biogenesis protein n=1 Tax=Aquidulcibacter sp. TaxID=2052990 RepID=UPI0022C5E5AB|nr:cytochrome c-type biogenesis protein [Aquidulcibacter sp.]MCE2890323.1 cytochrome c-type biogenesis protein CcmH [Hyphomonadaceae bacterium]MCZ8208614.1 cytochrome c-type biogenesis protein CcmH [Aquidulcibacter sp.]
MKRLLHTLLLTVWLVVLAAPAGVQAVEAPLTDPALEARAQSLAREIRCVVCENEPVALSSAEIAVDMRKAIRERIAAGDSDAQVRRFFADRYGEFVLLRPRIGVDTFALWGAPLALLLLGGLGLFIASRRGQAAPAAAPAIDDTQALAALKEFENKPSAD